MGCTAGCLNIILEEEKHIELFAETFVEVLDAHLYESFEKEDIVSFFDTEGDIMFSLDAEPIFAYGHGHEHVIDFLLEFIKKTPETSLEGDYYSDWDNCCDIVYMKFEYSDGKLSLMRLFSEVFGIECGECGEEVEMSDVEIDFDKARRIYCPECGTEFAEQDDEEFDCNVFVDDFILENGEWVMPEEFKPMSEGDEYLTGIAPDEITNAWKYEDLLALSGVLPELPIGLRSWVGLPRIHAMAEQGDEKAIEILEAYKAYEASFDVEKFLSDKEDDCVGQDCCCDEEDDCCSCCNCGGECCAEEEPEDEDEPEIGEAPAVEAEPQEEIFEKAAEAAEPENEEESVGTKKKSKWWIIPLVIALIAACAAAVQLLGLYDLLGLLNGLLAELYS